MWLFSYRLGGTSTWSSPATFDLGAQGNLQDEGLAVQIGCSLEALSTPIMATALDRRIAIHVTYRTTPATLVILGSHSEIVISFVISALNTPLVLGYTWLHLRNPQIQWILSRVIHSIYSGSVSLNSAPQSFKFVTPILWSERGFYHWVPLLAPAPPLWLCHWSIIPFPTCRLFNLSEPKTEAMQKLQSRFPCCMHCPPPSSPPRAGYFFLENKDQT